MTTDNNVTGAWFKSSYSSGGETNCVETALCRELAYVRDTKDRDGGHLTASGSAWRAFLETAKQH